MSEFSPTETALEGLRVARERPVRVLWWWGAYLLTTVIVFLVSLLPPFRHLSELAPMIQAQFDALQQNQNDQAAFQRYLNLLGQAAPAFVSFAALVLLLQMVLSTAILRAVLRPAESAFGYLRLSMDELRQLGLVLIFTGVGLCYLFAVAVLSGVVLSLLRSLISPVLMNALAFAVMICAVIYPAVRLSLAPAMTLADRRISFLRSWPLTKGLFWPLFSAYALAFGILAFLMLVRLVSGLIVQGHAAEPTGLSTLLRPSVIAILLFNSLFGALMAAVFTAPIASAFRQITDRVGAPTPVKPASGSPWGRP